MPPTWGDKFQPIKTRSGPKCAVSRRYAETVFNIGAGEMIVIALILLMAVGPEQLPGLIRRVGRTVSDCLLYTSPSPRDA